MFWESPVGGFAYPPPGGGGCLGPTKMLDKKKRFRKMLSPMVDIVTKICGDEDFFRI